MPTPVGSGAGGAAPRCPHHWSWTPWSRPSGPASESTQTSVGSVGDSYDNALAETINGLYKTELIKPRGPWKTVEEFEIATAEWIDWFNHRRLYEYCGDIPPADLEGAYYAQHQPHAVG